MLLVLALTIHLALSQQPPVPTPARPAPHFSWDVVPRAFHGANRTGLFTPAAVQALANYSMVTIEKWYTPCGAQAPSQAGPSCAVEDLMFTTFRQLKALQPSHTNIIYLNSMFDFAFYRLNGLVQAREAAGERLLLRDMHGQLVTLCNDSNFYCNVSTFDWTQPAALALWLEAVANATAAGGVDGVFADHLASSIGEHTSPDGLPQLCNGKGELARCWNFTAAFAAAFNTAHAWLGNHTQDLLAQLPGRGPVVDGPYSSWAVPACDYVQLRAAVEAGQAGLGPYVLEANHRQPAECTPDDSCLANFLAAAEEYTYLACFADAPVASEGNQFSFPLGPPTGPPLLQGDTVTRSFLGPLGLTNVSVQLSSGRGEVAWAGQPPPPPPPPPPPAACGLLPPNTALACCDIAPVANVSDAGACCALCAANAACAQWCYHGEAGAQYMECHLHSAQGKAHALQGATSGVYQRA
jgi:hypothetical protein